MPSKRCATSAKRSGNCSSARVTNRMACWSRCEIQVQASHRRILTACSRLSTARNRAVWGLGCRSAGRLSKRTTDGCGRALTCHVALSLASLRRPIRPPHREWKRKMAVDGDEGNKVEEQPGFLAQLQAILNVLPAYTWYAAPSGALIFVNRRTADYLGLPEDHPLRFGIDIGAQWDDWVPLLHPDDQEEARQYWSSRLRTGEAGEHSYRVRNAQGDYRWFLTRFEPLRAGDGTLLLWIGATLDIEELMCAQEALRESERSARSAIDGIAGLITVNDSSGKLETVNRQVLEYFGRSLESLKNWGTNDVVHPEDLPRILEIYKRATAS